ncbi:uncharacterized protein LOC124132986 [Haliotis rufescens]|uniref:uncharacterized protein LOC124132986 n=1 Tax=Haliotis rufescens TaxID=6454 RepID=UPI00201E76BE|nr:uncharacterized protein LOC124132986 [Haliotis rufescens]
MAETASTTEETPRKIRKKRIRNFSVDGENIIQSMVESNSQVLHGKLSSEVTNKKKSAIWMAITKAVNMKGVALRSVDEVKEKWSNMTRKAKKTFTDYRLQQRKTGGGPPPSEPSQATSRIIEIMQDSASFSGISRGLESEILPSCAELSSVADPGLPTGASDPTPAATTSTPTSQSPEVRKSQETEHSEAAPRLDDGRPARQLKYRKESTKLSSSERVYQLQERVLSGELEKTGNGKKET